MWNDLPYTVFGTGTLDGFKGAVNHWLLPLVCFPVFCGAGAFYVAKAIYKKFDLPLGPGLLVLIIIIIIYYKCVLAFVKSSAMVLSNLCVCFRISQLMCLFV